MNLQEIIIKSDREPESLHGPDDEDDGITLRDFTDENLSDDMAELLGHLKAAESWGSGSSYIEFMV